MTAEEEIKKWNEQVTATFISTGTGDDEGKIPTLEKIMIGFAKFHVQKALEAAAERAIAKENPNDYGTGSIWVDENSILKAYPETNII